MSRLSAKLRAVEGDGIMFWCPGCESGHMIRIGTGPGPRWGYNGNAEKPTFRPSILVRGVNHLTDEQHAAYMRGEGLPPPIPLVCHMFVTDGNIQFLADCTHALAGQTVPMPDWDAKDQVT